MSSLPKLGTRPGHVVADEHFDPWFVELVGRLVNAVDLVVAGDAYRFAELEVYYHGDNHADLFAHRDPVQLEHGRWYFHRTSGVYRGGSFKGLDLTFGDGKSHFGVLVRTLIAADGTVYDGPCVLVDHLLAKTKAASVSALDGLINARSIWDATSPVHIRESAKPRTATVYRSSRIGLTLKKAKGKPDAPRFVARPYRFLTDPDKISKGKPHLVLTLYRLGEPPDRIAELTGSPKKSVAKYIADYEAGKLLPDFSTYIGQELSTGELCKMLGTWAAKYAGTSAR